MPRSTASAHFSSIADTWNYASDSSYALKSGVIKQGTLLSKFEYYEQKKYTINIKYIFFDEKISF